MAKIPGGKKEPLPATKPMPFDAVPEFADWALKQPRPAQDDKGAPAPKAKDDQKEPRQPGTPKPVKGGKQ